MNEDKIRQGIRNFLIESLDEVHLTLKGKYVPYESNDCYFDLKRRIEDAELQRNCCDRGTAARMHYNGLLSLLRNKIKKHPQFKTNIVVSLNENILKEEATLFSTFVKPAFDIFETSKMATLEALSASWMILKSLITFDPAKIEKLIDDHEARVNFLENKYYDVLKANNAAISSPDARIAFMLFAPNLWSTMYAKDWSKNKIKSMKKLYNKDYESFDKENNRNVNNSKVERAYLNLKSIFESREDNLDDTIIYEFLLTENQKKSIKKMLSDLITDSGFQKVIKEIREVFSKSLKNLIVSIQTNLKNLQNLFDENSEFGKKIKNSKNLKELQELIQNNLDLEFFDLEKFKNKILNDIKDAESKAPNLSNVSLKSGQALKTIFQINNLTDEMKEKIKNVKDPKEMQEIINKFKENKINQAALDKAAQESIINQILKDFFTKGKEQIESYIKETKISIEKILESSLPFLEDPKAVEAIKESDQELYDLIKNIKKS
jgi:hypothetical protein